MTRKTASHRYPRGQTSHPRVPAFIPVSLRSRAGGWSAARQAAFLAALAITRSVKEAAERVGMSRESAYRLRRREDAASFAEAWDKALGAIGRPSRKVTSSQLADLAHGGRLKPVIYGRRHVATVEKPDNSALLRLIAHLERSEVKEAWLESDDPCFAPPLPSTSG